MHALTPATVTETETDTTPKTIHPSNLFLINDDINSMTHVVVCLTEVLHFPLAKAVKAMKTAHEEGSAIIKTAHREQLETYAELLAARNLTTEISD